MDAPAKREAPLDLFARARAPVAANDDFGKTEGDKWRWLITGLTAIHRPLGVYAAQRKLAGDDIYDFCAKTAAAIEALGDGGQRRPRAR